MRNRNPVFSITSRPIKEGEWAPRRKLFFIFEGTQTERKYFENGARLNPKDCFVIATKTGIEKSFTTVEELLRLAEAQESGIGTHVCTYADIICDVVDCCSSDHTFPLSAKEVRTKLKSIIGQETKHASLSQEAEKKAVLRCLEIFQEQIQSIRTVNWLVDQKRLLNEVYPEYDKKWDQIVIVLDRDPQFADRTKEKLAEAFSRGAKKNYRFLFSNPCIEFWFLLAYKSSFTEEERKELLLGKKPKEKNNAAFNQLKVFEPRYNKDCPNSEYYYAHLKESIEASKLFCTDLNKLIDELGTNIGLFMAEEFSDLIH